MRVGGGGVGKYRKNFDMKKKRKKILGGVLDVDNIIFWVHFPPPHTERDKCSFDMQYNWGMGVQSGGANMINKLLLLFGLLRSNAAIPTGNTGYGSGTSPSRTCHHHLTE